MKIPNGLSTKFARPMLRLRKASPQIMFAAGIAGVVTAGVLACRSTLQLSDVLADNEEEVDARNLHAEQNEDYANGEHSKDLAKLKVRLILDVAKLYAPAVGIAAISIGLLTGSHVTLNRRNAAGAAAYAALDQAYKGFQTRVAEKYGEEEADKLRQGTKSVKSQVVDDAGKLKNVKRDVSAGYSEYAQLFEESNVNWRPEPSNNRFFLHSQERYWNDHLQTHGHVFLNDVYKSLGLPATKAGQVVGWVAGEQERDGYISFGVFDNEGDVLREFMDDEGSVWLDFNVDGMVLDLAF